MKTKCLHQWRSITLLTRGGAGILLLALVVTAGGAETNLLKVPQTLIDREGGGGSSVLRDSIRLQEVYSANQFPTQAIVIHEIRWRPSAIYGTSFTGTLARLQINLSTTLKGPGTLSSTFSANVGGDDAVAFDQSIELKSQFSGPAAGPKGFDIAVPLTTPFVYDPSAGNLLVDIRNYVASTVTFVDAGVAGNFGSRVFAVGVHSPSAAGADAGADALELAYTIAENPPPPPPANILRGPYLQSLTTSNVIVRWRTDRAVRGEVRFGTNINDLGWATGEAEATTEHAVTLNGLQPGTHYYYAVGAGTNGFRTGESYSFVTHPEEARATRIWAIGDSGTASIGSSAPLAVRDAYLQLNGTRKTDVWLMLGDNAYYSGTDSEYQAAVFNVFEEMMRSTPVWSTIGNHETYAPDQQGRIAYTDIFSFPQDGRAGGTPSGTERYYSFDYGNVHFVCLDSELSDRSVSGPMLVWLEQDLAANTKDWTIAYWHSPPYSKGSHNSDTESNLYQMRQNALPVLESFGVDLVLCGHSHSYERSHLLAGHYGPSWSLSSAMVLNSGGGRPLEGGAYSKDESSAQPGTVYVVAGSSGQTSGGALNHPAMFVSLNRLGSMVIDIETNRLEARFLRENGAVDDHFTVLKGSFPPTIVEGPQDKSVFIGQGTSFTVNAVGMSPLVYQWFFNEAAIEGATNATLTLTNIGFGQAGYYSVRVTNSLGSTNSSRATLAVTLPSQCEPISVPPNLATAEGGGGSSVLRVGIRLQEVYSAVQFHSRPMVIRELRWRPSAPHGSAFTGTLARLQINLSTTTRGPSSLSTTFSQNVGIDDTVVFDGPIELKSQFSGPPSGPKAFDIVVPLTTPFVYNPAEGNLLVDIRNHSGGAITYVDAGITGGMGARAFALGASSTTATGQDSGADAIQICASALGTPLPQISSDPVSQTILIGETATFAVTAMGSEPLIYQWLFGGNAILEATNQTLQVQGLHLDQAGAYSVIVANNFGSVTSAVATLTINYPPATLSIGSRGVSSGGTVELPVELIANGVETSTAFSIAFLPSQLTYLETLAGEDLPQGALIALVTDEVDAGRLGIVVTLPAGHSFVVGAQELVRLRFGALPSSVAAVSPVTFGDDPVSRRLSIDAVNEVSANYLSGSVSIVPTVVRAIDAVGVAGSEVVIWFDVVALGNENAVGFSIGFNAAVLGFQGAVLGAGLPDGSTLLVNTNLAPLGYLGVAVGLPAGVSLPRGTQQLAGITFRVSDLADSLVTPITFGNLPIASQVSDAAARPVPAVYVGATVTISQSPLEGDVAPRPVGDRTLGIIDWVQAGRFAAGLDEVGGVEFQRVDCAPRSTRGNGIVSVADWVQVGRYSTGLDPITGVGGPIEPLQFGAAAAGVVAGTGCEVRITNTNVLPGEILSVPVSVSATGAENALGFSVTFDASKLHYGGATKLSAATAATLNLNSNQVSSGRLGVALALPINTAFSPGLQEILLLTFQAAPAVSGTTTLGFGDSPVLREAVSVTANAVPCYFTQGEIVLGPAPEIGPTLSIVRSSDSVVLFWPASETGFELYSADAPRDGLWSRVNVAPIEIGGQKIVTLPRSGGQKYFRLRKP